MLEGPRCGSCLRRWNDTHECDPRDDSRIQYNLAITDEEKAVRSESVRLIYGIDERFSYRNRPLDREIILR